MNYTFKLSTGEELRVFYNGLFVDKVKKTHGTVSFWKGTGDPHREYVRTVRVDEDGRRFFTWDHEKVFMDQFLAYSPEELVKRYEDADKNVIDDDLCHTLEKYGMDSLLLEIKEKPLTKISFGDCVIGFKTESNHDKPEEYNWITYQFLEEYNRMPQDGYKLKLVPADKEQYEMYPKEDYYVSDLNGLILRCRDQFRLVLPKGMEEKVA